MKILLNGLFCLLLIIGFSSCEKENPCYTTTCENGGACDDGICNCLAGYGGPDCSTILTPVSMTITKIELTDYPVVQGNGSSWDPASGADLFMVFHEGTSTAYNPNTSFVSDYASDVTGQSLTTLMTPPYFTATNLTSSWSLDLWDYDNLDPNDFMTGLYFVPLNEITATGYPSSFTVGNAEMTARIEVLWNY